MRSSKELVVSAIEKIVHNVGFLENDYVDWDSVPETTCDAIADEFPELVSSLRVRIAILHGAKNLRKSRADKNPFSGKEVTDLAARIYDYLGSIPRKYLFLFPLPSQDATFKTLELSKDIEVGQLSSSDFKKYTDRTIHLPLVNTFVPQDDIRLEQKQCVLKINTVGYVSDLVDWTLRGWDPFFTYKIIVATYLVFDAIKSRAWAIPDDDDFSGYKFYCYDIAESNSLQFVRSFSSSSSDNKLMKARWSSEKDRLQHANQAISFLLSKQKETHVKKLQQELKNSLYWFYEACQAHLPHLKPVFLVTAYDAFFESQDSQRHIANTISLITSDSANAEKHRKDTVGRLYNLRNQIVHGEKSIGIYNQSPMDAFSEQILVNDCTSYLKDFLKIKYNLLVNIK